ncbi:hypothetical protein Kpho02_26930 [Kitasatospora phosalacinea]|uniref:Uncharacterized protein n=1 Tax=Kitasatospora phosalacinea TaxID=2065 RepID=A0A9W6Q5U8_9ACTN|nr:hypothetical protein [Kitasatospora phosalacinea]GLW70394.1 hypothetical protein Kpho02_26930 [Kitasatospora phosalacinea]
MTTERVNPQAKAARAVHGAHPAEERRRHPVANAVRNVGIVLDTAARVLFLGRDGVKL